MNEDIKNELIQLKKLKTDKEEKVLINKEISNLKSELKERNFFERILLKLWSKI